MVTHAFDLVVRGGLVVDGTGAEPFESDVAIAGGRIAAVGNIKGPAHEEIDARGLIVTPGFVDIHTHYDGQAVWDERLQPSSLHGVTTVVMTNCGVGFAPVRPADRDDALWAAEQAMRSGACAAVLFWLPSDEYAWLRRLQMAAEAGRAMAVLFR